MGARPPGMGQGVSNQGRGVGERRNMNGKVAKRIRAAARQAAANDPTVYKIKWFEKLLGHKDGVPQKIKVGTVYCTGFRRIYQDMKRDYLVGQFTHNPTR